MATQTENTTLTKQEVHQRIEQEIEALEEETGRPDHIHGWIFEATDRAFGDLVKEKRIDQYTFEDMIDTFDAVATIIDFARDQAWVEDDHGLWEGCEPYGLPASVAFYSLQNLFHQYLPDSYTERA